MFKSSKLFKLTLFIAVLLFSTSTLHAATVAKAVYHKTEKAERFKDDEVLVKFKPGTDKTFIESTHKSISAVEVSEIPKAHIKKVKIPKGLGVEKALEHYRKMSEVEFAEPNYLYKLSAVVPNDQYYGAQADYLSKINLPEAWSINTGASNPVTVAVIDTGVNYNHYDLNGKVILGHNYIANNNYPLDDNGHGTNVAGIIASNTNNHHWFAGVNWGARILAIKVFDANGDGGTTDRIASAIIEAADKGAKVINLSLGTPSYSPTMKNAIDYARGKGAIIFAAAGNESSSDLEFPASNTGVISVGATDTTVTPESKAVFSNYNRFVDLSAPGVDISGPYINESEYTIMSGTSQATPHAAGLASLLMATYPSKSPDEIARMLIETAVDLGSAGRDDEFGYGRIDALAAINSTAVSEEDSSDVLKYTGVWSNSNDVAASKGSFRKTAAPGASVMFQFRGTKFSWFGPKGSAYGIASVSVDGGPAVSVDLYKAENDPSENVDQQQLLFGKTNLTDTLHTVVIQSTGTKNSASAGYTVGLDAIDVSGAFYSPPTQPTNLIATAQAGGVALSWTASTDNVGVAQYKVERSLDGSNSWAVIGTSTGTSYIDTRVQVNTPYYYRVTALDGSGDSSPVSDTATVTTLNYLRIRIEQNDPAASYTGGGWQTAYHSTGYSGGSTILNQTVGASVTFNFTGTGVSWYGVKSKYRGISKVYVDGVLEGTVDQYSPVILFQQLVFQKTGLSNGPHTIKIETTGTMNPNGLGAKTEIDFIEAITDSGVPVAPMGLTATPVVGAVNLTWSANADVDLAGYNLYRSDPVSGLMVKLNTGVPITGTSYSDASVSPSTEYTYELRAIDLAGTESEGITQVTTTPLYTLTKIEQNDASANYSATGWSTANSSTGYSGSSAALNQTSNEYVTFSFSGNAVTWYGIKSRYRGRGNVYIDNELQGTYDQYAPQISYQQVIFSKTGLSGGPHTLKIEATGTAHSDALAPKIEVDFITYASLPDTTPPSRPIGLAADNQAGGVALSWTASTDNVGVAQYKVERSLDGSNGWTIIGTGAETSYLDGDTQPGTTYYYRVTAVDGSGNSSPVSDTATVTTLNYLRVRIEQNDPAASYTGGGWQTAYHSTGYSGGSTILNQTAGAWVTFNFTGTGVSWYGVKSKYRGISKVYVDGVLEGTVDQYSPVILFQQLVFQKTGLTNGPHTIKIETTGTMNPNGLGAKTEIDFIEAITDSGVPVAPMGLTATPVVGAVNLTWSANADVDLAGYNLYRSDPVSGLMVKLNTDVPITGTSYSDASVSPSTAYTYELRAIDLAGTESEGITQVTTTPLYTLTKIEQNDASANYSAKGWSTANSSTGYSGSSAALNQTSNEYVTFSFSGNAVTWYGIKSRYRGRGNVYIDNELQGTYDQYAPQISYQQVIFSKTGLSGGPHTLKIEATGTAHSDALAPKIEVDFITYASLP